jgi:nanoRNase/pAp phosphatase (c-di-AMP/oligoRNAs hydrolase)
MIFGDPSWPAESLGKFFAAEAESPVSVWIEGRGWVLSKHVDSKRARMSLNSPAKALEHFDWDEAQDVDGKADTIAIVGLSDTDKSNQLLEGLRLKKADIKILQVGARGSRTNLSQDKRSVAWKDLLCQSVDKELFLLSLQERVRSLQLLLKDSEEIAILLQDDPDPDGLAGALALRKLLGRNSQTAPIVTFGAVTRPENVAMAKLLDIDVLKVDEARLQEFEKVVLVDCQPSFFKGRKIPADVVLDHHPRVILADQAPVPFEEIREDLGSTSTMMTLFLRAAGIAMSQRLATALLYGIKSDTLMLNREVSEHDLSAFVYLYPQSNGNTLRRIERPELPLNYLESLRKGLRFLKSQDSVTVLPLPSVTREEWIPQSADFALQIENTQWALGCGLYQGKVIVSGRNCGYVHHCGDVFKALFNEMGIAGGHKTMAKAIVPKAAWEAAFGTGSSKPGLIATVLIEKVLAELEKRAKPDKNAAKTLQKIFPLDTAEA